MLVAQVALCHLFWNVGLVTWITAPKSQKRHIVGGWCSWLSEERRFQFLFESVQWQTDVSQGSVVTNSSMKVQVHRKQNSAVRFVSDIAIFVLKRDVKLQLTNSAVRLTSVLVVAWHIQSMDTVTTDVMGHFPMDSELLTIRPGNAVDAFPLRQGLQRPWKQVSTVAYEPRDAVCHVNVL